jgi:DNA-binding NarL/FixJ family response regulator
MVVKTPQGFAIVGAGLSAELKEFAARTLPECHFLESSLDSWRTARFCKLVGATILIVDFEALKELKSKQLPVVEYQSTIELLALCSHCDEDAYTVALSAGCSGVLASDSSPEMVRKAVAEIGQGILWYPRSVLSALARKFMLNRSISRKSLTARETEILRLLGMDQKNQTIADQLCISRETVRWHLRTLYSKIGVKNRSEAQQYALKHQDDSDVIGMHDDAADSPQA